MAMKGKDRHLRRLKAISDPTGPTNRVLRVLAQKIRADAHQSITAGSVSGKNHVPSAPGKPPNNDTGGLAKGLIDETFPAELRAEVRAETEYSSALEFGTSKMQARPFIRPARDKNAAFGRQLFAEELSSFVKGSGK